MNTLISPTSAAASGIDFKILTKDNPDHVVGYRLGARTAGPSLVAAGHNPVADLVFDRLLRLQPLCRLRGTLTLIYLQELEDEFLQFHGADLLQPMPDEVTFLPHTSDPLLTAKIATKGYWSVLRMCTRLGMISGRGVQFLATEPA